MISPFEIYRRFEQLGIAFLCAFPPVTVCHLFKELLSSVTSGPTPGHPLQFAQSLPALHLSQWYQQDAMSNVIARYSPQNLSHLNGMVDIGRSLGILRRWSVFIGSETKASINLSIRPFHNSLLYVRCIL
jgi:hypothetical protein